MTTAKLSTLSHMDMPEAVAHKAALLGYALEAIVEASRSSIIEPHDLIPAVEAARDIETLCRRASR